MSDLGHDSSEPVRPSSPGPLALALFLASAVILFGGILTGYALLRLNHPGAFSWAPTLLARKWGLIAAGASLATSLLAAAALRLALAAKVDRARTLLVMALFAAASLLVVRAIELPSMRARAGFSSKPVNAASVKSTVTPGAVAPHVGDSAQGKRIFLGTCAACHAPDGSGVKGQGQNLRESQFLKGLTDDKALAFVKTGRQPFDPESKLHLAMPSRGGNPALTDANLLDAIAFVRELQQVPATAAAAPKGSTAVTRAAAPVAAPDQPQWIDGELWLPHTVLPAAAAGPAGSVGVTVALQKPGAEGRSSSSVRRFFSLLLFVNGLHTIYVFFGILLGLRLQIPSLRGPFPKVSIALAAAYWIVIGAIGLVLVPAFYS